MRETEVERGRKLENMRLSKKRRVLSEVPARLPGWQTALGQAGGAGVGKQLLNSRGGVSVPRLIHGAQMELFPTLFPCRAVLIWPF